VSSSGAATIQPVLALDFDGVLVDSIREVFVVSVRALEMVEPTSRIAAERLANLGPGRTVGSYAFDTDPIFESFRSLAPLGNRAEDFGVALAALESGPVPTSQTAYDAVYGATEAAWRNDFHQAFYAERRQLRDESLEGWIALHRPYPGFASTLTRLAKRLTLAIATAKDATSVRTLVAALGYDGLFDEHLLLDKEAGVHKTAHLRELHRRSAVSYDRMTFVDDKLNHLERVKPLGVHCVLAAWGHNTDRELESARRLGFSVATLESFEAKIDSDQPATDAREENPRDR